MTPAPVGLRCPEHSGKPQGVRRATVAAERAVTKGGTRPYPVTIVLIAINVGLLLVEFAIGGSASGTDNSIFYKGALFAHGWVDAHGNLYAQSVPGTYPGVGDGGWWRLITSMFLHAGPIHLILNMLGLYWLGRVLEHVIGSLRYALLYFASGLAGAAGALYLSPNSPTVGASGAIFGILGALLVLERRGAIQSGGQILALIVLNLVITFSLAGISIGGHIGGLIGGVVLMLLYLEFRRSTAACVAAAVGVSVAAVIFAYATV
jgi:membrane associated rhomboid family serine protease